MAGSVAGVRDIKNVSLLSKDRHGAHRARDAGRRRRAALRLRSWASRARTCSPSRSRKTWQLWRETMSNDDWWGPGLASPKFKFPDTGGDIPNPRRAHREDGEAAAQIGIEPEFRMAAIERVLHPPTGTINCSAVNAKGEMSGATTTSGLAWKIAGRAGDSPIIGAGCYTDQDVGSAGATGNGEENIKVCGAHTIVENMRRGMSPQEAGMDALKRIVRNYNGDMHKLQYVDMSYYILRKDGAYAGVLLVGGPPEHPRRFAVHDDKGKRYENAVALFQGASLGWPPMPGGNSSRRKRSKELHRDSNRRLGPCDGAVERVALEGDASGLGDQANQILTAQVPAAWSRRRRDKSSLPRQCRRCRRRRSAAKSAPSSASPSANTT